jgi:SAM-dependent methyltransferase
VLELGHGPGHLQVALKQNGVFSAGVDASRQMSAIARRRLRRAGVSIELILGYAQYLAFKSESFAQVIATFPADFILEETTLAEIYRVLTRDGQFVVILGGWLTGRSLCRRLFGWLLGRSARHELNQIQRWLAPFQKAGFQTEGRILDRAGSQVFLILASK